MALEAQKEEGDAELASRTAAAYEQARRRNVRLLLPTRCMDGSAHGAMSSTAEHMTQSVVDHVA